MPNRKIRYAVVGQGYISQAAVLPGFRHARNNSELVGLVSSDTAKLKALGKRYRVKQLFSYEQFGELLRSGEIDAVYIALPNDEHHEFAMAALRSGVHVLCEKPLAVTARQCEDLIHAARDHGVKLMSAYRLHFEEGNLCAIDTIRRRKIGDPKIFHSVFTVAVDAKNYRAGAREEGGGPMYDVGVYCLNAARYLFQAEPIEVSAMAIGALRAGRSDAEETMAVTLRFDGDRVANFVCSFGAFSFGSYRVIGTRGQLSLENAYDYVGRKTLHTETTAGKRKEIFSARDQFGAELLYFSECVLKNREPEPSGIEGLADVRIIEAIFESANTGHPIPIEPLATAHPGIRQEIHLPPVRKPTLVRVHAPSKKEVA